MYVAWGWGGLHPNVYVAWGRVGPMPEGFIHPHTDGGAPHALALQGMGWRGYFSPLQKTSGVE